MTALKAVFHPGDKYGRLTVTGICRTVCDARGRSRRYVPCQCACGTEKEIRSDGLTSGLVQSCGCLHSEISSAAAKKSFTTHGKSGGPLHRQWKNIKQRCCNPRNKRYPDYGGRGVVLCEEWCNNFESFYDWAMANGYREGLEIDRRENNGNYCPENCRFVTSKINNRNKRSNKVVTAFGESKILIEWVEDDRCLVCLGTLQSRLNYGWDFERAMTTPVDPNGGRFGYRDKVRAAPA